MPVTEVEEVGKCKRGETGTIQRFLRDDTIFDVLEYDWNTLVTPFSGDGLSDARHRYSFRR